MKLSSAVVIALLLAACSQHSEQAAAVLAAAPPQSHQEAPNPTRNAYFGDLHVHTRYSFDAFIFGTTANPDDAYTFAKGGTIKHPAGFDMKLDRPLDFEAVTDHGMYLGMVPAMTDPSSPAYQHPEAATIRSIKTPEERRGAFVGMFPYLRGDQGKRQYLNLDVVHAAWSDIIAAAERNNDPGKFTAFIGYEYTSDGDSRDNLHRNVIFRGSKAPDTPFTRLDSSNPEDLWAAMDRWRQQGIDALAIPHNSNGSGGRMFQLDYYAGNRPIDNAYAETRSRNEPVVEITQTKGTSETHPMLSPNDEWANFEIMPYKIATTILSKPEGSYVRDAYLRGLAIADGGVKNPYKLGVIGSSDTHVAAGSFDETNYWSKTGLLDSTPELRGSVPGTGKTQNANAAGESTPSSMRTDDGSGRTYRDTVDFTWGTAGLAGVWAEQNTRESIFEALRRKETFATTGTRIRVRFFGGAKFAAADLDQPGFLTRAYADGVAMGGELSGAAHRGAPTFAAWAMRDPMAAPLQRLQIVKGWTVGGEHHETIYDVACSDGLTVDRTTHRCPDNKASVDVATCKISDGVGADELKAVWSDPEFDPGRRAFYYVRVLENPTCRWSTWDAIRTGVEPRHDVPATIQERAFSSPIWYEP
jgi:hypothetical protein